MATAEIESNRSLIRHLCDVMYNWKSPAVTETLGELLADDAVVHLGHPFGDLEGAEGWFSEALEPLAASMPDLERRTTILTSGSTEDGQHWVGCAGYYTGTFAESWLDIPPTNRQVALRFHEFFRVRSGEVAEIQALWDIPHLMMQANAWPMGPSLGREWQVPGPSTQDGLANNREPGRTAESYAVVRSMLADMSKHPAEPVEAMNLEKYWHPNCSWYGPSGIGTGRGIDGFRKVHQIPFLNALPDRAGTGGSHFWADGDYVAVTGWPNMTMTVSGDGWLGIAPPNTKITMRSLDFWRVEGDLIRENWVLVDLLDVWDQLGVNVLQRMKELPPRGS